MHGSYPFFYGECVNLIKVVADIHSEFYNSNGNYPTGNYLSKVNNKDTRTMCEICSKLTIKIPEQHHGVALVSLLLTSNIFNTSF